jgi:type IV pilus assembly protein PilO
VWFYRKYWGKSKKMPLNELSFDGLGSWPISVRIIALAVTFISTLALGYLFLIKPYLTHLHHLRKKQSDLTLRYQSEYKQAALLPMYEEQLTHVQKTLTSLSIKLTTANEIPQLINTISKLAIANNLEVSRIKPEQENTRDFYVALPINISVTGDYPHLALFISQVESLQKIIAFDDFTITTLTRKENDDRGLTLLMMNVTATVYMSP